mgnify:FL=1
MTEPTHNLFDTPCLVVDEQLARRNIREMQQAARAAGCTLRPHIKTHKMPYFAKLQLEAGAVGITSCKISEAEVMAAGGLRDIFIAYPLVGAEKLRRACVLSGQVDRLILAVDSIAQAEPMAKAAEDHGCVLEVRIEVDCGGGRTGIEMEHFAPLVAFVENAPGLKLTGLYTFRGLNGGLADPAQAGAREAELLAQYRAEAEKICGRRLEVSGGSSPTGLYVAQSGQADEIRPGTYIFSDYMMHKECGAPLDHVAARLLVTVVSVHQDYVVVDGGCKTFPTDAVLDQAPYYFETYAYFPQYPQLRIRKLTEEHGMVTAVDSMPDLHVGDILEAIPLHICPTVNLQNQVYVVDGGCVRTEIVAGRGKLQ